jgi:hypothetical protein
MGMSTIDSNSLKDAINMFQLRTIEGVIFWPPYIRNDNFSQDKSVIRGLGKSYPAEIQRSVDYICRLLPHSTTESIRRELVEGKLPESEYNYKGIDCSGFVYIVFEKLYKDLFDKEFYSVLSVPKEHVINGALNLKEWSDIYHITKTELESLPSDVPMDWVVRNFKRNPVNLCRVKGLISDYSSTLVNKISDYAIGDLLYITNPLDPIPHVGILTSINTNYIEITHSGRENATHIGGIQTMSLTLQELKNGQSNNGRGLSVHRLRLPN